MMFDYSELQARRPLLLMVVAAAFLLLAALLIGPQTASAQQGVTWEQGNFCVVDRYTGGGSPTCEANDVRISNLSPSISEACIGVGLGETTTVQFTAEVLTTSTTRYSIGFFIAQDGNLALNGNVCYHDFLQPAITPTGTTPPLGFQTTGSGPYRNVDGNACADTLQNDGLVYYRTQVPVTITCIDANNDGIVDPISTCTSWEENANGVCNDVTGAAPGTPSKCNCGTVFSDIKVYRGLDFGDLPDSYGTLLANDGARHAVQERTGDNTPDTITPQGVTPLPPPIPGVWLGSQIDFSNAPVASPQGETNGQPSTDALGDDAAYLDDEDGITPANLPWYFGTNGGAVTVDVSSSTGVCAGCQLGFWIDWNNDGDFSDSGESYVKPVVAGSNLITFDVPNTIPPSVTYFYARFRLYAGDYVGAISPTGLVVNGEVEDYRFDRTALSITLANFSAEQVGDHVLVTWETASELNNRGFNLYRATAPAGPFTQLNSALIPSQSQGSPSGFTYTWQDRDGLVSGTDYYYLLEDLDLSGATTSHGPVSVSYVGPTAVGFSAVQASPAAGAAALPTLWVVAAAAGAALAASRMRRRD
jgi:hypothetical protein